MPFSIIGFFLALETNSIDILLLVKVTLCMIFARSSAMAFNRYIDRYIDKKNNRTSEVREIPKGTIKAKNALIFVWINSLFFILTTYFINKICFYLSPIALIIILGYSYTKRYTSLCHLFLGLGLSLAPLGSYLAVSGEFNPLALIISFAVLFWVSGFDIIYSLQDEEFDKTEKLNSIPVLFGRKKSLYISVIFHCICVIFLLVFGFYGKFKSLYWIGLLCFTTLLFYQHKLIKPNDLSKINLAFFTTNGIASIIFGIFFVLEILLS